MKKHMLILLAIFLLSFILKVYLVTKEPMMYNIDAGYYVKHINEVFTQGYPDVSDPPIAFYYAALFVAIFGMMLGFKIAISLASAAIAFPVYFIVNYITKKKDISLFAAFLVAFSDVNMFMMGDLLKNMLGLFFGAWFIYFIIKTSDKFNIRDALLAFVSLFLMVGSHFSSSAYIILCTIPFLILLPVYNFHKTKKLSKESVFCIALLAVLFFSGITVLLFKGYELGNFGIIRLNTEALSHISFALFNKYSLYALLFLIGMYIVYRTNTRYFLFFLLWLVTAFLLTQPLFVDEAWTFRFEWNTYVLAAIVSAIGAGYFRKDKSIFFVIILLVALFLLQMFWDAGHSIAPVINLDEWEGLLALHESRPDIVFTEMFGGAIYWTEAAGFEVSEPHPDKYLLVCIEQHEPLPPHMEMWNACHHTINIPEPLIHELEEQGKIVAQFGRFYVIKFRYLHP